VKRAFAILTLILAGCGSTELDTGYRPRPLTDGAPTRRAYYTNPYSADANPEGAPAPDPNHHRPRGF
jgi:hypothetical protein